MPRNLPQHVYMQRTRHGKVVFYHRIGKGKRTRLPNPASPEFIEAYQAVIRGLKAPKTKTYGSNSLSWLIRQYRQSAAFLRYSRATKKQQDNIFLNVEKTAGHFPYRKITRKHIVTGREDRKHTPFQAKNFLAAMRGLFRWALDSEFIEVDPTAGVRNPHLPKTKGFEIWDAAEVEAFRNRWPLGTHQRVWLEILIGTGARRGDAVTVGRQHIQDNTIRIKTAKQNVWAYPPLLPEMSEAIERGPVGDLTFIVGIRGQNLTKESFGNMFRTACSEAGVTKSAHGLRKYSATRYAELGLTEAELETIFGWVRGSGMAAHYSEEANRKHIAKLAEEKIVNRLSPHLNNSPLTSKNKRL